MAGYLLGGPGYQLFDNVGDPLAGGKLHVYAAGTTTYLDTFSTSGLVAGTENANPVILDAYGRPDSGAIYLPPDLAYKFVCMDADDVLLWTQDQFTPPTMPS
tara:strand:- start:272 stop:577 length:306 start_codon:yes stop_codon:yes gene_type:complete